MPPEVLEPIAAITSIVAIGSLVLVGMKMRYTYLQRTRVGSIAPEEVERLGNEVDALRHELQHVREEVLELNDRVEFTERLLERPKTGDEIDRG
jgi:hypothetical protein